MYSWNKSNVLEEVDNSDGGELEYESMVQSFGSFQPYLFVPEKPNLHQDSSKQIASNRNCIYQKRHKQLGLVLL